MTRKIGTQTPEELERINPMAAGAMDLRWQYTRGGKTLWHYTSQSGLLGIFDRTHPTIRLGDVRYMNDARELLLATELFRQRLAAFEPGLSTAEHRFLMSLHEAMTPRLPPPNTPYYLGDPGTEIGLGVFAFCCSEEKDDLNQWRGYGSGTAGYAIGFDTVHLDNLATASDCMLVQCIYDEGDQVLLVNDAIAEALARFRQLTDTEREEGSTVQGTLMWAYMHTYLALAARLKDKSFAHEKEWRVISQPMPMSDERLRVRAGTVMPVPYMCLDIAAYEAELLQDSVWGDSAVRGTLRNLLVNPFFDVVIGPNGYYGLARESMSALLGRRLYGMRLHRSRVPYRPL